MHKMLLKPVLFVCAFGWLIAAAGIFLPWPMAMEQLNALGANIPDDGMLNYWFRMTAAAFTFIGFLYIYMAIKPQTKLGLIRLAGCFHFLLGVVLAGYGL